MTYMSSMGALVNVATGALSTAGRSAAGNTSSARPAARTPPICGRRASSTDQATVSPRRGGWQLPQRSWPRLVGKSTSTATSGPSPPSAARLSPRSGVARNGSRRWRRPRTTSYWRTGLPRARRGVEARASAAGAGRRGRSPTGQRIRLDRWTLPLLTLAASKSERA
jgi:hypothetical protein